MFGIEWTLCGVYYGNLILLNILGVSKDYSLITKIATIH